MKRSSSDSPQGRPGRSGRWAAASVLSVLLAACYTDPAPLLLGDQDVPLGYQLSGTVQQTFGGSWTVEGLPVWLSASPQSGKGDLNTVIRANRSAAVQTGATAPKLAAEVKVAWTSADGQKGTATLKVSADLYRLSGQVQNSLGSLNMADLHPGEAVPLRTQAAVQTVAQSRGVIVRYRSQGARVQAMRVGAGLTMQGLGAGERFQSAVGQVLTLSAPDVQATLKRLRSQPEVEYAVPDATLFALDLGQQGVKVAAQALQPQQVLAAPLDPGDQFAPLQWAFRLLGYPAVWRDMQTQPYTRPVTVAVLDTGIRYDHPDLKGQLYGPGDGALDVLGYTLNDQGKVIYDNGDGDGPDTDPTDPATKDRSDISHGTHVSGIIAANWGNFTPPCDACSGSGVVGASYPAPIRVLPVRVLDAPKGDGSESDVALAIRYAAGDPVTLSNGQTYTNPHPAQVINLSLGSPLGDSLQIQVLCDSVARATALGSLVVAAGGNFYGNSPVYPAACPGALAVASVSLSDSPVPVHASYSDQYPQMTLSAPGGSPDTSYNGGVLNGQAIPDLILSTGWDYAKNEPGYYLEAGTSQAAPQVAALAALLLSKGVAATPAAALDRMLATASDLGPTGHDDTYGVGLINPAAALGVRAVANTLGLSVQADTGHTYVPALDPLGRFSAYLPDGAMRVVAGRDSNSNGFAGETGEPQAEQGVTLGPALPSADIGRLTP